MLIFTRKRKFGTIFSKKPNVTKDGLLLEIINSFPSSQSCLADCLQKSEVLFLQVAVNPEGDCLAASDVHGNVFVFDLIKNTFHLVKHLSMPASCLCMSLRQKSHFMVALSDYSIRCYDSETQSQIVSFRGHERSIVNISVHSSKRYALSASSDTAFLWNLDTNERKRRLTIAKNVDLLLACFIPGSNSIMTCFKDNSILVWDAETMELLHELKSSQAYDVAYRTFACNFDGSSIAAAGKSNLIHLWDLATKRIMKVLQLSTDTKQVKQLEFLPKHLYPEEIIAVVCSNGVLRVIDVKNSTELLSLGTYEHKVIQISCATSTGILACLMDSGNIKIYDLEPMINAVIAEQRTQHKKMTEQDDSTESHPSGRVARVLVKRSRMKEIVNQKVENSKTLNNQKLLEILKEFGEFPEKYRLFIWKTLLHLPENYQAYSALVDKGVHPSYVEINKIYPIRSLKLLRVFQRLLSAIAFWAPVAVESTFVPTFVFPFAKLLQNNQLLAFEVVACVLLNWCQKWFDFIPNPPLTIMSLIENILAYHDKELFQHFVKYRVTTQMYAWPLLLTGFSEVFMRNEWMKLWDHIITNQPSWLLLIVVAYTLVNRTLLLDCYEIEEFKQFYRSHNGTGVNMVIAETYKIMKTTPTDLDPGAHLAAFTPLHQGQYQTLSKFPQRIKDFPKNATEQIRKEQLELLKSDDLIAWNKR